MGLIVDEHEELRCRDCGEPVTERANKDRLMALVFPLPPAPRTEEWRKQRIQEHTSGSIKVTLPGACTACGGGRIAYRAGTKG